ncbi:MAG TPA: hypothetical protein DCZ93_02955 [Elusimicrobia bacterium]|nr:hypothetical protein [Elusimicrobiota bacterium]
MTNKKSDDMVFVVLLLLLVVPLLIYGFMRATENKEEETVTAGRQAAPALFQKRRTKQNAEYSEPRHASEVVERRDSLSLVRNDDEPGRETLKATDASSAGKRHELDFLRRHDREIGRYQNYLSALGRRYMAKYPALRGVDSDFARMDRYMALKTQYEKDRDAYKWVRGVMALPEVRAELVRCTTDPEVLKAIVELSLEALNTNPPPAAVKDEALRVLAGDEKVATYVADISGQAAGNIAASLPLVVTPGMDLSPLQNMVSQVASGQAPPRRGY